MAIQLEALCDSDRRFWSRLDKSAGDGACWLWTGAKSKRAGYGVIRIHGKLFGTHRVAYALTNGPIPRGMCVCHACDVRLCCNPAHLWLGTKSDNAKDRHAKGRTASGESNGTRRHPEKLTRGDDHWTRKHPDRIKRGDSHGSARVSESMRLGIMSDLASGLSQTETASRNGVSQGTVSQLKRGVWRKSRALAGIN